MQNTKRKSKLKFCYTCQENSVTHKTYTPKSGIKTYIEYCINKNPMCNYKFVRRLSNAASNEAAKTSLKVC